MKTAKLVVAYELEVPDDFDAESVIGHYNKQRVNLWDAENNIIFTDQYIVSVGITEFFE